MGELASIPYVKPLVFFELDYVSVTLRAMGLVSDSVSLVFRSAGAFLMHSNMR